MPTGAPGLACGFGVHRLARRLNSGKLLILCYHGVARGELPAGCPSWHHVQIADFERQIGYLVHHYDVLPIDLALERLAAGSTDRTACITFDDGYLNNRSVALPVLRQAAVPATVYLATGFVSRERVLWTVELEAAFRTSPVDSIDLAALGLGVRRLSSTASRSETATATIRWLKRQGSARRQPLVAKLVATLGPAPADILEPFRMLEWSDVEAMDEEGLVSFGAHTVNHEIVSHLEDDRLEAEIGESIAEIGRRVRNASRTFAYPNGSIGDFDDRSRRVLNEAGVHASLTTIEDLNDRGVDPFALRRIVVGRDLDFDRFRLATSGVLPLARRVRRGR
jgi:peptidoglycan/xylan/chitin deacetylase (PgdA/CDA1 family)